MLYSPSALINPRRSILVVDDDGMIAELLVLGFEKHGFKVFKAENGLEAWDLFNSEQIDFVLTDIQMPVMGGKELSNRIRNQSPNTIIALMTGAEINEASALIQNGIADYFFQKPFKIKNICRIFVEETQAL